MAKTVDDLNKDKILTILKHSGELPYGDILSRGGAGLANVLLELVNEGKVKRRSDQTQGTMYSLAIQTVEDLIKKIVCDQPGIKGTGLVTEAITSIYENGLEFEPLEDGGTKGDRLIRLLTKMANDGELVEVEYVLPSMDYRIKSLYFPKGTIVTVPSSQQE